MEVTIRAVVLAAALAATAAHAEVLNHVDNIGPLDTSYGIFPTVQSGVGAGSVDFTLYGTNTLDGDNYWIDIFTLGIDGQTLLVGTWNMHGGGDDRVLDNPSGATVTRIDDYSVRISAPLTFTAGLHQLSLTYASPTEFENSARAGFQGLDDEGWGVRDLTVTGPVPEPAPAALLAAGLAVIGLVRRRGG